MNRKQKKSNGVDWSILEVLNNVHLSDDEHALLVWAQELKKHYEKLSKYSFYYPKTINAVRETLEKIIKCESADEALQQKAKGLRTVLNCSQINRQDVIGRMTAMCKYVIERLKELSSE